MQAKAGFWNSLYQNLASMKLTVFIFLTLAACSLIGTLFPQGLTEQQLHSHFSPGIASWIDALGLSDLYHTGWFRLLLLLLCLNLIVCTIQRLPKTLKLLRHREDRIRPEKLSKFAYHSQMTTQLPLTEVEARLAKVVSNAFAPSSAWKARRISVQSPRKAAGAV